MSDTAKNPFSVEDRVKVDGARFDDGQARTGTVISANRQDHVVVAIDNEDGGGIRSVHISRLTTWPNAKPSQLDNPAPDEEGPFG